MGGNGGNSGSGGNDTSGGNGGTIEFTLRIPEELATRIGVAAARERKSKAQWIREALRLVVERVETKNA